MYPYFPPGYRPPILSQPPPIPRPSYLHHYQYTHLHVNPSFNMSLPPPLTQPLPPSVSQSQPTAEIAFEPPPRDRRILEKQENEETKFITDETNRNSLIPPLPTLTDNLGNSTSSIEQLQGIFKHLTANQVASLTTENYIKYLDNGCFIGETIAKRNEQRPCFKNIQNLCNRTRSEVIKPNITVSNIHSQGVPWATKDFIFAFVRAINCWCILRGYLGAKDGNLGKIEREISTEFRECYANWEKCTKQLTYYLIQTFHNLDEANSSSNQNISTVGPSTSTSQSSAIKTKFTLPPQESQRKAASDSREYKSQNKETGALKKIPGILHIPASSPPEIAEACIPALESTEISPREEDSDNEGRIYMKPGSYNVPTRNRTNSPPLGSPKYLNKTKNSKKTDNSDSFNSDDQIWQTAQSVTPDFIKLNEVTSFSNSVKKIYDMSLMQPNKHIESWLNNELNIFGYIGNDADEERLSQPDNQWQATSESLKMSFNNDCEVTQNAYRSTPIGKEFSMFRKSAWEFKNGGLTNSASDVFENILKELKRLDVPKIFNISIGVCLIDNEDLTNLPDLSIISKKLQNKMYCYVNEVIHDFRHFINRAYDMYSHDRYIFTQIGLFQDVFEKMVKQSFVGLDFTQITGAATDTIGPIVQNERGRSKRNPEGDGDH